MLGGWVVAIDLVHCKMYHGFVLVLSWRIPDAWPAGLCLCGGEWGVGRVY